MPQKPNTSIVIIRIICVCAYICRHEFTQLQSEIAHYSARAALATGLATSNVGQFSQFAELYLLYKSSCFIEHMLKIIISTICSKGRRNKNKQNTLKIVISYVCVCLKLVLRVALSERRRDKM